MDLDDLRYASKQRQIEWSGSDKATLEFRALEVAGECGEVAEAVKKYLRSVYGIKGSTATVEDIADEMADAIIAIDLLAEKLGIDLSEAVKKKFNMTSMKYDLDTTLA